MGRARVDFTFILRTGMYIRAAEALFQCYSFSRLTPFRRKTVVVGWASCTELTAHVNKAQALNVLAEAVWRTALHLWPRYLVRGWRGKMETGEVLSTHLQLFSTSFKNIYGEWGHHCTPNWVNVFEIGMTLPGRCEVSLAVTTPCRLQLCITSGAEPAPNLASIIPPNAC